MKNAFKIVVLILTIMSIVQAFASSSSKESSSKESSSKEKGTKSDIKITIRGHGPTI
ncbi:MAG: hypothetical protein Q7U04_03200 [Bacteriovorax sp.]|nr:hypothetical protein [Bacteriovorax sp.]